MHNHIRLLPALSIYYVSDMLEITFITSMYSLKAYAIWSNFFLNAITFLQIGLSFAFCDLSTLKRVKGGRVRSQQWWVLFFFLPLTSSLSSSNSSSEHQLLYIRSLAIFWRKLRTSPFDFGKFYGDKGRKNRIFY